MEIYEPERDNEGRNDREQFKPQQRIFHFIDAIWAYTSVMTTSSLLGRQKEVQLIHLKVRKSRIQRCILASQHHQWRHRSKGILDR
jgi:tRNA(Phe) wybutosine-synthesizing methylase Tyw3